MNPLIFNTDDLVYTDNFHDQIFCPGFFLVVISDLTFYFPLYPVLDFFLVTQQWNDINIRQAKAKNKDDLFSCSVVNSHDCQKIIQNVTKYNNV